jgi:hypothetical protein
VPLEHRPKRYAHGRGAEKDGKSLIRLRLEPVKLPEVEEGVSALGVQVGGALVPLRRARRVPVQALRDLAQFDEREIMLLEVAVSCTDVRAAGKVVDAARESRPRGRRGLLGRAAAVGLGEKLLKVTVAEVVKRARVVGKLLKVRLEETNVAVTEDKREGESM